MVFIRPNSTTSCLVIPGTVCQKTIQGDPTDIYAGQRLLPTQRILSRYGKNLCSGTTYEFAAWVLNVLLPSACGGNGIQPT